jgi:urease beta subunit
MPRQAGFRCLAYVSGTATLLSDSTRGDNTPNVGDCTPIGILSPFAKVAINIKNHFASSSVQFGQRFAIPTSTVVRFIEKEMATKYSWHSQLEPGL